ncbi:MAG: hypothetical protein IJE29_07495 [Firmicutes bacterium]|nr:hypothetical protein [Bacillota bacterium]
MQSLPVIGLLPLFLLLLLAYPLRLSLRLEAAWQQQTLQIYLLPLPLGGWRLAVFREVFNWAEIKKKRRVPAVDRDVLLQRLRVRSLVVQAVVGGDAAWGAVLAGTLSAAAEVLLGRLSMAVKAWPAADNVSMDWRLLPSAALAESCLTVEAEGSVSVAALLWAVYCGRKTAD